VTSAGLSCSRFSQSPLSSFRCSRLFPVLHVHRTNSNFHSFPVSSSRRRTRSLSFVSTFSSPSKRVFSRKHAHANVPFITMLELKTRPSEDTKEKVGKFRRFKQMARKYSNPVEIAHLVKRMPNKAAEILQTIESLGLAGVVSFLLINIIYYSVTLTVVFIGLAKGGAQIEPFKVVVSVWAVSQVNEPIRIALALFITPFTRSIMHKLFGHAIEDRIGQLWGSFKATVLSLFVSSKSSPAVQEEQSTSEISGEGDGNDEPVVETVGDQISSDLLGQSKVEEDFDVQYKSRSTVGTVEGDKQR